MCSLLIRGFNPNDSNAIPIVCGNLGGSTAFFLKMCEGFGTRIGILTPQPRIILLNSPIITLHLSHEQFIDIDIKYSLILLNEF